MKQALVKPIIVKINKRFVKKYETVMKPVNSWKEINRRIDELFDKSLEDYTLLHKPHNEYYWAPESVPIV